MADVALRDAVLGRGQWAPWTIAGGPDPDFGDGDRQIHHLLLTDARLLTCFRQRFPAPDHADYDDMIRLLGYVWDCPHDRSVNVTGYRCARCGRTRAVALA